MALRLCFRCSGNASRLLWRSFAPTGRSCANILINNHPSLESPDYQLCRYSSKQSSPEVTYEQLKQRLTSGGAAVIDVREPWELKKHGSIPGAVNVPVGKVETALQLSPEEFKEEYGAEKPHRTDNIVFSCLAGSRSTLALATAQSLGYVNAQHYPDGWRGWSKHEKMKK